MGVRVPVMRVLLVTGLYLDDIETAEYTKILEQKVQAPSSQFGVDGCNTDNLHMESVRILPEATNSSWKRIWNFHSPRLKTKFYFILFLSLSLLQFCSFMFILYYEIYSISRWCKGNKGRSRCLALLLGPFKKNPNSSITLDNNHLFDSKNDSLPMGLYVCSCLYFLIKKW